MLSEYYRNKYRLTGFSDGLLGQSLPGSESKSVSLVDQDTNSNAKRFYIGDDESLTPSAKRPHYESTPTFTNSSLPPLPTTDEEQNEQQNTSIQPPHMSSYQQDNEIADISPTWNNLRTGSTLSTSQQQKSLPLKTIVRPPIPAESSPSSSQNQSSTTQLALEHSGHQHPFTTYKPSMRYDLLYANTTHYARTSVPPLNQYAQQDSDANHNDSATPRLLPAGTRFSSQPPQYPPGHEPSLKTKAATPPSNASRSTRRKNKFSLTSMLLAPRVVNDERYADIIANAKRRSSTKFSSPTAMVRSDSTPDTTASLIGLGNLVQLPSGNLTSPHSIPASNKDLEAYDLSSNRNVFDESYLFDDTGLVGEFYIIGIDKNNVKRDMTVIDLNKTLKNEMENQLYFARQKQALELPKPPEAMGITNIPPVPSIYIISHLIQHHIPGYLIRDTLVDHILKTLFNSVYGQVNNIQATNLINDMETCLASLHKSLVKVLNDSDDPEYIRLMEKYKTMVLKNLPDRIGKFNEMMQWRFVAAVASGENKLAKRVKEKRIQRHIRQKGITRKSEYELKQAAFKKYDIFFQNIRDALK